jgi:uncharacterized protein (TIGR02145 family)
MKNVFRLSGVILLSLIISLVHSCKKDKPNSPIITTIAVTEISYTSAISGGDPANDGGSPIISKGVCWNTTANPTIENAKTTDGEGLESFTSQITHLAPNTIYYLKAYATNVAGTGYGNQLSFTTSKVAVPGLTTTTITSITQTSAVSGGNIIEDNGGDITERGVCWSTTINPTINNDKTSNGGGIGSFTSTLTELIGNTSYYVRAYASNSAGTEYGNQVSFKTAPLLPLLSTTTITSITQSTAKSGGNISSDGGATITDRGVCWSISHNPTIENNRTRDETGIGTYTSSIGGLIQNTIYFVRAYATNSVGTAYGNELSFTSSAIATTLVSSVTQTTAMSGGNISSDFGAAITDRGICWKTAANPTITDNKTTDGAGTGVFTSSITGLTAGTTYYIRAYATNSLGTYYGNELIFNTYTGTIRDVEGNEYKTITIGTQTWMAENLKTITYNDGTPIPQVSDATAWSTLSTPAYCWYNNNEAINKNIYGALYNWYTVNTNKLCPIGWHVPSYDEWTAMTNYLGGWFIAGDKLKESGTMHWYTPNNGATNETSFTAFPGGYRYYGGSFLSINLNGTWWGSAENNTDNAWNLNMSYNQSYVFSAAGDKRYGSSIRCVKD